MQPARKKAAAQVEFDKAMKHYENGNIDLAIKCWKKATT
jgi:hypothetical protein